jgi:signal transduction histidine kinase
MVALMTAFPDTASAAAISKDLLAASTPISLGAPAERGPDVSKLSERPVSVRRLVTRFALAGLPVLAAAIVVTAIASIRIGTKLGIDDAKRVSLVASKMVHDHALDDRLVTMDPTAIVEMDRFVHDYVLTDNLVIVKIHAADGTVLYSNETGLIGQNFELGDEELDLLDHQGDVVADISELTKDENSLEDEDRLLEVYRRTETPQGVPLLFETYFRYSSVRDTGRDLWSQFAPIAVGALIVLALVQIPFAISLARRLRAGQLQRERLLQHAIESSDQERRRIASDLHDGAVQDLTGVSMALTAGSRVAVDQTSREAMTDAGAKIRETVKSLRSMLVDIYPPNLHQEGLQSALADLLGALHNREMLTSLDVDVATRDLSSESVNLLYRAAQEALRNVTNHSHANSVSVSVSVNVATRHALLVVEDDGVGFDPETLANRLKRGHVGLRSLAGLVHDAGGAIDLKSVPGVGTRVEVRVPR